MGIASVGAPPSVHVSHYCLILRYEISPTIFICCSTIVSSPSPLPESIHSVLEGCRNLLAAQARHLLSRSGKPGEFAFFPYSHGHSEVHSLAALAEFTQIVKLCFAWDPGCFQSLSACPPPVSSAGLSLEADSSNESSWVSVWGSPASTSQTFWSALCSCSKVSRAWRTGSSSLSKGLRIPQI